MSNTDPESTVPSAASGSSGGDLRAPGGGAGEEREIEVQHEPQVIEGEDEVPHQPAPPLDPYTPEPGPRPGEGRAFRVLALAFIPIAITAAIVIWALVR